MGKAWDRWKKITEKIGDFQATFIFSVLYLILIIPFGLISQIFTNFLHKKDPPRWEDFKDNYSNLNDLKKQ